MGITASMVKELREKTGAGMMDCKKALVEVAGDLEKAVDWLRQKGMAKAAKKAGRATSEGLVAVAHGADGKSMAMAALLCETDFVARGEQFQNLAAQLAKSVLENSPADAAALEGLMGDTVKELIASAGEDTQIGKIAPATPGARTVNGHSVPASGTNGAVASSTSSLPSPRTTW